MNISIVYINTHRYDYESTCICVASVRYWYPDIPIFLIKDLGQGHFDTSLLEEKWGVRIFETSRKRFGWGYGKLEPLFLYQEQSFLMLDSDTVLTGRVIDKAESIDTDFLVDDEIQPTNRFNEIYYNLYRINELDKNFIYPGYSFNSGQWFGTSALLCREDFSKFIEWSEPPIPKFPDIIFKGDQSVLNFILHSKEQSQSFKIVKKRIMIWPSDNNANFIDIKKIMKKVPDYPYIIHWAGMKFDNLDKYPRADILRFYLSFYYKNLPIIHQLKEKFRFKLLPYEKWFRSKFTKSL